MAVSGLVLAVQLSLHGNTVGDNKNIKKNKQQIFAIVAFVLLLRLWCQSNFRPPQSFTLTVCYCVKYSQPTNCNWDVPVVD